MEWQRGGRKQRALAEKLGLSVHTLSTWRSATKKTGKKRARQPNAVRAVKIAAEPTPVSAGSLIVRTPSGLNIEGLSLHAAIALAKELG